MSKYLAILMITALIVLAGCRTESTNTDTDTNTTNGDSNYTNDIGDTDEEELEYKLGMSNQEEGTEITVDSVTMEEPGFLVIHEKAADGNPGAILGNSSLLEARQYTNVKITLSRATKAGGTLITMAHQDNGDGTFDAAKDNTVMVDNTALMKEFTVTKVQ